MKDVHFNFLPDFPQFVQNREIGYYALPNGHGKSGTVFKSWSSIWHMTHRTFKEVNYSEFVQCSLTFLRESGGLSPKFVPSYGSLYLIQMTSKLSLWSAFPPFLCEPIFGPLDQRGDPLSWTPYTGLQRCRYDLLPSTLHCMGAPYSIPSRVKQSTELSSVFSRYSISEEVLQVLIQRWKIYLILRKFK